MNEIENKMPETIEKEKVRKMYDSLLAYQEDEHTRNTRKIRNGLRTMAVIPAIFLVLMLLSGASGTLKIVFLVLWIGTLFAISTYLIIVEYMDHKLQSKLSEIEKDAIGEGTEE